MHDQRRYRTLCRIETPRAHCAKIIFDHSVRPIDCRSLHNTVEPGPIAIERCVVSSNEGPGIEFICGKDLFQLSTSLHGRTQFPSRANCHSGEEVEARCR